MYTKLVLFRNELKNRNVSRYKLIGIITELIMSKEIFEKNKDISAFMQDIFGVTLKDYILKSRSQIMAYTCRIILSHEDFENKDKLLKFINLKIDEFQAKGKVR